VDFLDWTLLLAVPDRKLACTSLFQITSCERGCAPRQIKRESIAKGTYSIWKRESIMRAHDFLLVAVFALALARTSLFLTVAQCTSTQRIEVVKTTGVKLRG